MKAKVKPSMADVMFLLSAIVALSFIVWIKKVQQQDTDLSYEKTSKIDTLNMLIFDTLHSEIKPVEK